MKKTIAAAAALCVTALLLAGCTSEPAGKIPHGPPTSTPKATSAPVAPAPTPTVTVTVTATPAPQPKPTAAPKPAPAPHTDEAYATPTMSSAEAISECLAAQKRSALGSKTTGEKYAFLMKDGGWWVVLEGENEHGPLIGDCSVGGAPKEWQTEVGYGETSVEYFTPNLVDTVVNGKGGL